MKFLKHCLLGIASYLATMGLVLRANLYSQRTFDANLVLKAAGLVAASADGTIILDTGGLGLLDVDLIIDATAVEIDSSDESYTIILEGSPDATFGTAANIAALARIVIGHHSATAMAPQGFDDVPGRFMVPCRNERNGVTYRYLRIRTVVAGTIATGINYTAWLAKDDN
jgi:hypothetical protein